MPLAGESGAHMQSMVESRRKNDLPVERPGRYNEPVTPPVTPAPEPAARRPSRGLDPHLAGTLCVAMSALGYAATNICLRRVALLADPMWISCLKSAPIALAATLLVLVRLGRGRSTGLTRGDVARLVANGVFVQLVGNVVFQWTLSEIGLAMTMPINFGALMLSGVVMGRVWLGETITGRTVAAMALLLLAIVVLSSGAADAHQSVSAHGAGAAALAVAVLAAVVSGIAFAVNGAVIRAQVRRSDAVAATMMVVSATGVVTLGLLSVLRLGIGTLMATSNDVLANMALAGTFNAAAFFAFIAGLQRVTTVHANLLNASQTAICSVAAVLLFGEAVTPALAAGVALTVLGLTLIDSGQRPAATRRGAPLSAATADSRQLAGG